MYIERIYAERQINGYLLIVETMDPQPTHSESGYSTEKKLFEFGAYKSKSAAREALYADMILTYDKLLDHQDEKQESKPKDNPLPHKSNY